MDFIEIQKIIADFNDSPTRELEIETDGFKLRLSKNEIATQLSSQVKNNIIAQETPKDDRKKDSNKLVSTNVPTPGITIDAPMVGSVYLQPEPTKPSFVKVGSVVKKGDVVCIIEAMKMMTEIKSDVNGVVKEVLVTNEELVEFGQPLIRIEEG
ncbi:acetyl-CoA carboxylase biotin carboxyl carrier protein [Liquorilactobacillus cacaonum]|uniref:Biotin carboxyl carrier protein of acetyl-CoA carboxylase n=1 Tax=Liquorilactobacillus cacaonum DSM 21116 TaxID=1423729 RepID=A0A0R2CF08_9LACO|nr:acetyl-CoA carboxylase biotin carboxyl carrier protein [Liquorilactobacillus cacaonum]KRM90303.1 biotin carboxyl carrier protein of acetyl-CoA carboxylase [Liquorilactobacillus cacaonum DSM 21116]